MTTTTPTKNRIPMNGHHSPTAHNGQAASYKMPKMEGVWPFTITHLENGWGVSVATITPELAKELLEVNHENNRDLKQRFIDNYMRDMANKEWKRTHQGIAFNRKGQLFDGQNRLQACIRSGHKFETLVFFGVGDKDQMLCSDIGAARQAKDGFKASGNPLGTQGIATLSNFSLGLNQHTLKRTNAEHLCDYIKYREAIDWAGTLPKNPMLKIPLRGALCRAYYHVDAARLERFVGVFLLDIPATMPGDRTVVVLRKSLEGQATFAGGVARKMTYAKSQGAIRAFLDGVDLKQMKETDAVDLFPLPTEKQIAARKQVVKSA